MTRPFLCVKIVNVIIRRSDERGGFLLFSRCYGGNVQYYLIFGISLAVFTALLILAAVKSKNKGGTWGFRPAALLLAAVFLARYYSYNEACVDYIGLNGSPLSPFLTAVVNAELWLSAASVILLILTPFFDIKALRDMIRFIVTPIYVLQSVLIKSNVIFLMGEGAVENITFSAVMYAIETALCLAVCVNYWFSFHSEKLGKTDGKHLFAFLLLLLFSMPGYALQVFFGNARISFQILDLTAAHRVFLYMCVVFPVTTYVFLRDKEYKVRDFALTFISLATMVTFCINYKYDTFLDPTAWPIHLCNTAMFLVPICMIFKWKRLFYFTYFINVMGAFLAMLMPNYSDTTNLFSVRMVTFWTNHYCAMIMPILMVALKIFERPKIKQFWYSIGWFAVYFVFALMMNAWFSNFSDTTVDFFFLNSDFIPKKLGEWCERMFDVTTSFTIGSNTFVFHPFYQAVFFIVYIGIAFGIWFVYEQFFSIADAHYDMLQRKKKIKLAEYALSAKLNGRSISEPMYENTGICLELKNFSKKYGTNKNYAVRDANLKVYGGEIFGFLGPNGAGKSTIIKSIVGIQPITDGQILVCGYDVEKQPVMSKRQVGFVPDHYALYERLTGREYINYVADIYDVSKEDRDRRIADMVRRFELTESFDNQMRTYSHGMKQKIAIMAALIYEPKIWILDEPLTGLDPNSIFQVKECMREHAQKGNIVFFSSHIIDVVERICDRITIIDHGRILVTEKVEDIEKQYSLESFYMNTVECIQKADEEAGERVFSEEVIKKAVEKAKLQAKSANDKNQPANTENAQTKSAKTEA